MPRVSLDDIARRCGLSKMTVSRALRNQPYVRATKRALVLKAAKALGYRQDPKITAMLHYMRSSKRRRSVEVVALIWTDATRAEVTGAESSYRDYLGRIVTAASRRAETLGYKLEQFWLREPGMTSHRLESILHARGINGVIIGQPVHRAGPRLELDWSRFCVVQLDEHADLPLFQKIEMDNYGSVSLALAELSKAGHRKIALCEDAEHDAMIRRRWRAAFLAYHPLGPVVAARLTLFDEASRLNGEKMISWWIKHRPDVILLRESRLPEDWTAAIRRAQLREFSYVCLNLKPSDADSSRAGVHHSYESYAATAVEMVAGLIQRNERGIPKEMKTVTIDTKWVQGKISVG